MSVVDQHHVRSARTRALVSAWVGDAKSSSSKSSRCAPSDGETGGSLKFAVNGDRPALHCALAKTVQLDRGREHVVEPRQIAIVRQVSGSALTPVSRGAQQHDPSPPHMFLRAVLRTDHGFLPLPVARTKPEFDAFSHPAKLTYPRAR